MIYPTPLTREIAVGVAAVQLAAGSAHSVVIKADLSNVGSIYVGFAGTVTVSDGVADATTGFKLGPGDAEIFYVSDTSDIWVIADNAGERATAYVRG